MRGLDGPGGEIDKRLHSSFGYKRKYQRDFQCNSGSKRTAIYNSTVEINCRVISRAGQKINCRALFRAGLKINYQAISRVRLEISVNIIVISIPVVDAHIRLMNNSFSHYKWTY